MPELKCTKCQKKLAEVELTDGEISIKCKCGTMNAIRATPADKPYIQNQPYQNRLNLAAK